MADKLLHIRRVAVIGGGCCGAAAVKHLLAEKVFTKIDIFEQRSAAAGIWNYDGDNDVDYSFSVPKTRPEANPEPPKWRDHVSTGPSRANGLGITLSSPMYDRLEANLPKMMMQHSDMDFDDDVPLLPDRETIRKYLERYADEIRPMIQFETQVISMSSTKVSNLANGSTHTNGSAPRSAWQVRTRNLATNEDKNEEYDAVLIASGKYTVPFVPDFPSIKEWNERCPNVITHSKFYRRPEDFEGQKVLVVGVGPSGMDISVQIAQQASHVLISSRGPPKQWLVTPGTPAKIDFLPGLSEFLPESASVRFEDGTEVSGLDKIMLCTGYIYSYPFLPQTLDPPLIQKGDRVHNIYQHIFYNRNPTIAFTCLPWNIVPFPLAELQGAAIARVWGGRLALPSLAEMEQWEHGREQKMGTGKTFHQMPSLMDVDYMQELDDWLIKGTEVVEGRGKEQPHWRAYERWLRGAVGAIRLSVKAMTEEQKRMTRTPEDVGQSFDEAVKEGKIDPNTGRSLI